jgi:predicted dehydrogenase/nucleoside-diphosphate-sugar epimerase
MRRLDQGQESATMLLVTGASGFLGSAVVRVARQRGMQVRAMVRTSSSLALLGDLPSDAIIRADMTDPASLDRAVQGCDAVIHCAATVSTGAPDLEKSRKVNVEGTRLLLEACVKAGVRRFVNIGSQSAVPENPSVYGRTKLEQDRVLKATAGIDWTILKPSLIYGAEAKGIFHKMVDLCRKAPVIPNIGSGHEELRPVHADDVAAAALDCLSHPATIGKEYDLGGADSMEMREFVGEILKAVGKKAFLFNLPCPLAMIAARMLSLVLKNPPVTPDNVMGIRMLRHVDISAAERDFGYAPRPFARGLRESLRAMDASTKPSTSVAETNEKPIRIAIIGLGKMGILHATMCHTVPGVELVAVIDRDPKLGAQIRSMGANAPSFESLDEALAGVGQIDAAIVATPQFTHRSIAVDCLEKGLHVFCEKPLAHTLDDARAMAEAARRFSHRVAAIGFMKGHYPLWQEAARRLKSGWIGAPRRFRAQVYLSQVFGPMNGWTFTKDRAGGGILINSGIHLIHAMRMLFGDVAKLTAEARPMHSCVEDTLCALLTYRSGLFGSLDMSWSVQGYPTEGTTIFVEGDRGTMEIDDDWVRTYHLTGDGDAPRGWSETHRSELDRAAFNFSPDYGGEGYYNQIADFVSAIRNGHGPRYDWQEGLRVQEIVDAIYRSSDTGGTVVFAE